MDHGIDVLTFHDDRDDVMRRAMPRLAVGTAGWCLAIVAVIRVWHHSAPVPLLLALVGGIWLLSLLIRFDVFALQFGPRYRYELDGDEFRAYQGSKLKTSFVLAEVTEWVAASPAFLFFYWMGWGYNRHGGSSMLDRYQFKVSGPGSTKTRTVKPPALFRWNDRGGLEDVTRTLIKRLGPPLNYSINYTLDDD